MEPNTEVFGSTGSVVDGWFVRYSRKSITLDFLNGKFQFGDCQNICYSRNLLQRFSEVADSEIQWFLDLPQLIRYFRKPLYTKGT